MASPALSVSSGTTTVFDRRAHGPAASTTTGYVVSLLLSSLALLSPWPLVRFVVAQIYYLYQVAVSAVFTQPYRPIPAGVKAHGRIAIIGAGLTGIATAAAFVSHGFEVVIYDADDKVGGVWARVNSTSALQLNSLMYRFHPSSGSLSLLFSL